MTEVEEHIARWRRIWAMRLAALVNDMAVPPPEGVDLVRWSAFRQEADALAEHIKDKPDG